MVSTLGHRVKVGLRRSTASGRGGRRQHGHPVPGECVDLDDGARVRGVDELAAADVDADVAEPVEEDEVTGLEIGERDRFGCGTLGVCYVTTTGPATAAPQTARTADRRRVDDVGLIADELGFERFG